MRAVAEPGIRRVEHIMGMPIVVDVRDDDVDDAGVEEMLDWLRWVDATFSTYAETSEISRLNRGELDLADADPELRVVLARCDELRVETGGFFDVHAASPRTIDPSGLVKGWSVERAASILETHGARNFAVSAGGDIVLRGRAVPELAWRVGIQHPLERGAVAAIVEANDLAIATSGEYARGQHVFDPHTHRPPAGVLSVTITGPDLATADAYATAAFAMGADAPAWTARLDGYEAMTIRADGAVFKTVGFPG